MTNQDKFDTSNAKRDRITLEPIQQKILSKSFDISKKLKVQELSSIYKI